METELVEPRLKRRNV